MNDPVLESIKSTLEAQNKNTDTLLQRQLQSEAWVAALHDAVVQLLKNKSGKSEQEIRDELIVAQKAVYQQTLEIFESRSPGLAAALDRRKIGDVL